MAFHRCLTPEEMADQLFYAMGQRIEGNAVTTERRSYSELKPPWAAGRRLFILAASSINILLCIQHIDLE